MQLVPLREKRYRRIGICLKEAQAAGITVRELMDDLAVKAESDPESAMLLRDLHGVLWTAQWKEWDQSRSLADVILQIAEQLGKDPLSAGEEVLF